MKFLTVPAKLDKLDAVLDFINAELDAVRCPEMTKMTIDIAAEEIFVNIARYAYQNGGDAIVGCLTERDPARITLRFSDRGTPYNPLERDDPDITLDAAERAVGGLGIFMVKQSMDSVDYRFEDGSNIFTMMKNL